MKNNKQKVSNTLSGRPRQGSDSISRTPAGGGRDSAGLTNRGSTVGTTKYGGGSRSAGMDRSRTDVRPDIDDRMNAQVENPTTGEGATGSRNAMSSASSGRQDTTTGPGEARRSDVPDPDIPNPEREKVE